MSINCILTGSNTFFSIVDVVSRVFLKTKLLGRQIFMTDFVPLFLESMLWHKVNKKYKYKRVYKKYQYITVGKNKYLSCVEYYSS